MSSTRIDALDVARRGAAIAPTLKALSDPHRLTLLLLLAEGGPATVKELQEATGLGQTLVSHHLATLRRHELVSVEPRGRANVYDVCCEALAEPLRTVGSLARLQQQ